MPPEKAVFIFLLFARPGCASWPTRKTGTLSRCHGLVSLKLLHTNVELCQIAPGVIGEVGKLLASRLGDNELPRDETSVIPDAHIRVIPMDISDFDWVECWVKCTDGTTYQVSHGTDIMVASAALAILSLATGGRMTPQRLWRIAMQQKRPVVNEYWHSFDGIDYYGLFDDGRDSYPDITPGFRERLWSNLDIVSHAILVKELDELGDVDIVRQTIIWTGQYWTWMRPDRYVC